MNHRELCEIGAKFLKRPESANGHGCHFTIIEAACYGENPDVFGIRHGTIEPYEFDGKIYERGHDVGTVVLEAKVSRSDFLADRKKPHRAKPETGVGKWRYYICPQGLIKADELPEKWGLIYVSPAGRCKVVAGAMAVPKTPCGTTYDNKPRMWRSHTDVVNSFKTYAFNERNFQNEFNLMCMALARLQDPEQILYMQRAFPKLTNQVTELERLNKEQDRVIRRYERKYQIPEADRAPSFSAGILETLETLNLTGIGSNE
ncbi:adenylosuccinate synthase [Acinetobacter nosocomialis]|uniref:adenylosuccinate synthase n=1 Tax=Acinetobacter nosocomialis TaxID=106654 RepID=UPI00244854D6|nr:adenylosuccinate synthase [Acinetobacter nosocomialis]MDH2636824.1 adenylosuccinate synthase [Acinetobacter nosocomialis]